jgi:tRNA(fMet)-specific endonuclease VapC
LIFIDTNVAIDFRDAEPETMKQLRQLDGPVVISLMTRIELESGVYRDPAQADHRRRSLERLLITVAVIDFKDEDIAAYGQIVASLGHDRRLTLDRLIAAQAIARDAKLITRNGKDFRKIEGLKLVEWETPG